MQKNENNSQNKCEYEKETDEIEHNSEGLIGAFANNTLRIIDINCNFHDMHQEVVRRFECNDEIK